jgi:hypothetical protein
LTLVAAGVDAPHTLGMSGKASLDEKNCGWVMTVTTPSESGDPVVAVYHVAIDDQSDAVVALKKAIQISKRATIVPTQKLAASVLKGLRLRAGEVRAR